MVTRAEVRERLTHELVAYGTTAAYLYVCLGSILLYRAAVLGEHMGGALPYGTAAVKALVLAKFFLVGQAAGLGERMRPRSLVFAIVHRAALFLALLAALTLVEEAVVGLVHGESVAAALRSFGAGRWPEVAASCLLLWLVLLPLVAAQELRAALGHALWKQVLRTGSSG